MAKRTASGKARMLQLIEALPAHGLKPARLERLDARAHPSGFTLDAVVQSGPTYRFGGVRARDLEIAGMLSAPDGPTRFRALLASAPSCVLTLLAHPPAGVAASVAKLRAALTPPGLASALQDDTRATRALAQSVLGLLSRR